MGGKWIWAAGAVLVLLIGFNALRSVDFSARFTSQAPSVQQRAPAGTVAISMASSSTKQQWLHDAVKEFNDAASREGRYQLDGKPIFVEVLQEVIDGRTVDYRSGSMVADTIAGKIKPTILSPGEESWSVKFQKEYQSIHGRAVAPDVGPVLVRTPHVVVTWQSRARALACWPNPEEACTWERIRSLAASPDGWGMLGHPEWGKFKFGYGYVGETNSGTLTAIAMCSVGAGKTTGLTTSDVGVSTGCGEFMGAVEKAKIHSGNRSEWLLEQMTRGGPEYLDAIVGYESEVVNANKTLVRELREPLVAVYPQDAIVVVGHPFTILEGAPWVTQDQVAAAKVFAKYLLSSEVQRSVLALGFRPAEPSVRIESPIDAAYGANPQARLNTLDLPDVAVIDRIVEVWRRVKKHAIVALVFDKSGSMAGSKIGAAIKGAQEFVGRMDRDDLLIWMPFDSTVYPPVEGFGAEIGEELSARIASTPAGGGTALYDAVLRAYVRLTNERRTRGDTVRYGIVVLSDGRDANSSTTLSVLEEQLKPEEADPHGVQIHTIAIGSDADENVLKKIAHAAHGRYWKGQTTEQMVNVYRGIATYY